MSGKQRADYESSHDIKTPMTIITGYLDVVISGKYEDESERDLYIKKHLRR